MTQKFIPSEYQDSLAVDSLVIAEPPDDENTVPVDVLFVGGGPAAMASAIKLAQLVKQDEGLGDLEIAVLDKATLPGEHSLSGAVINPMAFYELFGKQKDFPFRNQVKKEKVFFLTEKKSFHLPTPPPMKNHGFYTASLSECVRWLAGEAEKLGIHLFNNFPADKLLTKDGKITGVQTTASGLDRAGEKTAQYMPPTSIKAQIVVLAEGSRGLLTQGYKKWQNITSLCPQTYALGVKEIWKTKHKLNHVVHTMGFPLQDSFGGSFMYPMGEDKIALGLVAGLDEEDGSQDVHHLLQTMKQHPLFQSYLKDAELLEWGAKTIPEGGYQSLPERFSGQRTMMIGDCVGFVNVPSLKGIHYSMMSGIYAAETIHQAFKDQDFSDKKLQSFDERLRQSFIFKELYKVRNMKPLMKQGLFKGSLKAGISYILGGRGKNILFGKDSDVARSIRKEEFQTAGLSKVDGVYLSGNKTRDDIPSHLKTSKKMNPDVAEFYTRLCPAGVYERKGDELIINAPNCVDCKATDVVGPRWTPREGGSGPHYKEM